MYRMATSACTAAGQSQGQHHRGFSHEQTSSHQPAGPQGGAWAQEWVQEGSKWHMAAAPVHSSAGSDNDNVELRRRVSELAGGIHLAAIACVVTFRLCGFPTSKSLCKLTARERCDLSYLLGNIHAGLSQTHACS